MSISIGQRIKQRREELGLTQEELAKKLGYANRSSVNKVETSREVSMKKINLYANALDTTVPILMGWEDENILEMAQTDVFLSELSNRQKEYVLKLAELPQEKQEAVFNMIDVLGGK